MKISGGRRSIRLRGYDYSSPGEYFVTICTHNRDCIFGDVVNGGMRLNGYGEIVWSCWIDMKNHYNDVLPGSFVTMPNHVHGIITIRENSITVGTIHESSLPRIVRRRKMLLPKIIGRFKMNSAKRINIMRNTQGSPVWQRNYFEHIIRDQQSLQRITEYIQTNPERWTEDEQNPKVARNGRVIPLSQPGRWMTRRTN